MPGIEPGASHMQSERSTTELHPLYCDPVKLHFACADFETYTSALPLSYIPLIKILTNSNPGFRTKISMLTKQSNMPGIEPGASHMQSERSTTELHPLCGFLD
ncbi:hypothetical protein FF38_12077 [Lucilia cuprina]|uniref:Uncharacterized protein n=1 Tax=Lucilia cuprina TaxID=7375 RepID=A0A0L0BRW1_LUCCU|nr:hypothetical protein FF38_12077 [Lucilia cuprina]